MKRRNVVEMLKELLIECKDLFVIDMVWLRNTAPETSPEDSEYELVFKATLDKKAVDCIEPIAGKYGLELKKKEDLWFFEEATRTARKLAFSSNEA